LLMLPFTVVKLQKICLLTDW